MEKLLSHDHRKTKFFTSESFVMFMAAFFHPEKEHTPLRIKSLSVQRASGDCISYELFEMKEVSSKICVQTLCNRGLLALTSDFSSVNTNTVKTLESALVAGNDGLLQCLQESGYLRHAVEDTETFAALETAVCKGMEAQDSEMLTRQAKATTSIIFDTLIASGASGKIPHLLKSTLKASGKHGVAMVDTMMGKDSALTMNAWKNGLFKGTGALKDRACGEEMAKLLHGHRELKEVDLAESGMTSNTLWGLSDGYEYGGSWGPLPWKKLSLANNEALLASVTDGARIGRVLGLAPELDEVSLASTDLSKEALTALYALATHALRDTESLSWKIFSVEGNEKLLQTADAGKDMGRLLAKAKGCEEIDLSKTGLSKEGIVALAEALKDTPSLPWTFLNLQGNPGLLESADVGKAVGQLMGKAQAFDFSLHNVTEDFLLGLAEALEDKAALAWKSFKVRGNEGLLSTTKAAGAVGALLAKSTACKEICLGSTGLGKEGLVAMAEALEDKAALACKSFDVGFNEGPLSTAKAAGAVGALLAKSTACEEIRLNSTGLGKEGLVALAEALKDTPSLPWKKVFG